MQVYEAIMQRRTIRKFTQVPVPESALLRLIDCARMTAYAANVQPLKFGIITDSALREKIFPLTKWAGYLTDAAPLPAERPTAYIAILADHRLKSGNCLVEAGAAEAIISLEAEELGLASCILGALAFKPLTELLKLPTDIELIHLVALGYPAQKSQAVPIQKDVKYYLQPDGTLCVPKRSMEEILLFSILDK